MTKETDERVMAMPSADDSYWSPLDGGRGPARPVSDSDAEALIASILKVTAVQQKAVQPRWRAAAVLALSVGLAGAAVGALSRRAPLPMSPTLARSRPRTNAVGQGN